MLTNNYTISELINLGKAAERFFESKLGYTTATFVDVTLRPNEYYVLYFSLHDDFQREISHDKRFKDDSMLAINLEGFWNTLEKWPNREQRELEVMARKLAALDANLDQIQSAQVLAFVARLQPEIDEIRRMITHEPDIDSIPEITSIPRHHPTNSTDDDEVPF